MLALPLLHSGLFLEPYASFKWASVFIFGGFTSVVLAVSSPNGALSTLPKTLRLLSVAAVGLLLWVTLLHWPGMPQETLLSYLVFYCIIDFTFLLNQKFEVLQWVLRYSLLSTIVSLVVFFMFAENYMSGGTFGNANMLAEFLGLSILIQSFSTRSSPFPVSGRATQFIPLVISIVALMSLTLLRARGVWGSLVIVAVAALIMSPRLSRQLRTALFGGVCLAAAVVVYFSLSSFSTDQKSLEKDQTVGLRKIRWSNTIQMILQRPITGYGFSSYEFEYLPFRNSSSLDFEVNENLLSRSPHNGYLEASVVYGIPGALLILVFILGILVFLFQHRQIAEVRLAFLVLIFILADAFVAFPMSNAVPFTTLAVVLGLALSQIKRQNVAAPVSLLEEANTMRTSLLTGLRVGMALSICFLSFAYFRAHQIETSRPDADTLGWSCHWMPSQWHNCIEWAKLEMNENPEKAKAILTDLLRKSPNNFWAMKMMASLQFEANKFALGCLWLKAYDQLFQNQSQLHSVFIKDCENDKP